MGGILRNTMFHYNIKANDDDNDDTTEHSINNPGKQTGNETNQEMERHLNLVIFEQPLHNFPVYFLVVYIICMLIYVLLSLIYYRVFHPWKIIMGKNNYLEHIEEGDQKNVSQQNEEESTPDEEIQQDEEESSPDEVVYHL